jgi:amidase
MTLGALTLILLAAFIHASWNLLNKRASGHVTFTVQDTAAVLEVVAGADPRDHVTAPAHGKKPVPYRNYAGRKSLASKRLGVVREFMIEATIADRDSIRIANQAIAEMKRLGATIVDPVNFDGASAEIMASYEPSFHPDVQRRQARGN